MRFWIIIALMLSGCHLPQHLHDRQTKKLAKLGFEETYLKTPSDTIHFLHRSSGKPALMLVHGFSGDGVFQWYKTAKQLEKHYDLILPDLWYHGESIRSDRDYSIKAQVELLNRILTHLNIDSNLHLMGNSYGGLVSTEFADTHPEKVDKLIVYDAAVKYLSAHYVDSLALAKGAADREDLIAPTSKQGFRRLAKIVLYKTPPIPGFVAKQGVKWLKQGREERVKLIQHLADNETLYTGRIYGNLPETFLIWGAQDELIPMSTYYGLKKLWELDSSHCHVFPKAAHVYNLENPKAFSKVVHEMLHQE